MLAQLNERWEAYLQCLTDSEEMLKKLREKFKSKLLQQSEEFKKSVSELVTEFKSTGPFSSSTTPEEALSQLEVMKQRLAKLKEEEQELRRGLGIFRIDHPLSKEIINLEKDIEALEGIWTMALEWNQMFDKWRTTTFANLQTQVMEDYAQSQYRKLHKLSKDYREKGWEIIDTTKNRVDQFRRTMPLMKDLHNKDMRDRHWRQIKDESQKEFDELSEEFTLESIIDLHFEENAQLINEVSEAAQKEAQIERGIEKVRDQWQRVEFEVVPFNDKGSGPFSFVHVRWFSERAWFFTFQDTSKSSRPKTSTRPSKNIKSPCRHSKHPASSSRSPEKWTNGSAISLTFSKSPTCGLMSNGNGYTWR